MRKTGVLMIHGLMGSPREYEALEAILGLRGYATRCVTLPGHGESPARRFFEVSAGDLAGYCLEEYHALAAETDEVFVVGHSLGGICTLLTAAAAPDKLAGAVSLAAPCEHAYFFNHVGGLLKMPLTHLWTGMRFFPEVHTGLERPDYKPWMMPKLLYETRRMFHLLNERLPNIEAPLCLAHSPYDLTVPYAEMAKIAARVARPDRVVTHTLGACGHQVFPRSRERDNVIQLVLDFMETECPRLWGESTPNARHPATLGG